MGKEFNPEAIKEKLAEIKEQEEVETFTCSGCLTDTAGLMFQDKLCKSCALELIAYSRKAQNHIDSIRPTKIYGEMKLKKDPKYISVFDGKELSKRVLRRRIQWIAKI